MDATRVGDALKGVAGQFACGVSVVVAMTGEGPFPTTASSFAVASLDPPLATLALRRHSRLASMLTPGCSVTVNVLRASDHHLAAKFSRADRRPGWDAFAGIDVHRREPRPPVLVRAAAWVDAHVLQSIELGDHVCVVMRVIESRRDPTAEPLIHHRGRFHGLGRLVSPDRWSPDGPEDLTAVW